MRSGGGKVGSGRGGCDTPLNVRLITALAPSLALPGVGQDAGAGLQTTLTPTDIGAIKLIKELRQARRGVWKGGGGGVGE